MKDKLVRPVPILSHHLGWGTCGMRLGREGAVFQINHYYLSFSPTDTWKFHDSAFASSFDNC